MLIHRKWIWFFFLKKIIGYLCLHIPGWSRRFSSLCLSPYHTAPGNEIPGTPLCPALHGSWGSNTGLPCSHSKRFTQEPLLRPHAENLNHGSFLMSSDNDFYYTSQAQIGISSLAPILYITKCVLLFLPFGWLQLAFSVTLERLLSPWNAPQLLLEVE